MSRFRITFSDLKNIRDNLSYSNEDYFLEYINSFRGDSILEKFKNILKVWGNDVSSTLNLNIDGKPTKIQFSYIVSQMDDVFHDFWIRTDDFEMRVGTPKEFQTVDGSVPVYDVVKHLNIGGISIDFEKLSFSERKSIIEKLPAAMYNVLMIEILRRKDFIVTFDNPSLKDLRFNFLSNEPYVFLKKLFSNHDDLYFRDIIFHLSKRLGGTVLMQSTPDELDYYIGKLSKEIDQQNQSLMID